MEIQYEDRDPLQKLHEQWASFLSDPQTPVAEIHKTDIHVYMVSAKMKRMSIRRRKLALKRRGPTRVLTGAYPIRVQPIEELALNFNITFNYEKANGIPK